MLSADDPAPAVVAAVDVGLLDHRDPAVAGRAGTRTTSHANQGNTGIELVERARDHLRGVFVIGGIEGEGVMALDGADSRAGQVRQGFERGHLRQQHVLQFLILQVGWQLPEAENIGV